MEKVVWGGLYKKVEEGRKRFELPWKLFLSANIQGHGIAGNY